MVYTDHQVRQFYVVDSTHTATPIKYNNRFYVKYKDPSGDYITTDKINAGCIRDIRISKQPGIEQKYWKITPSTPNSVVSNDYVLHLMFRDWMGIGTDHFYVKDPAIVVPAGSTVATVCTKLKEAIELCFKTEPYKPFEVFENGTAVYLVENKPFYNRERGFHRVGLTLEVKVDEVNLTGTYTNPVNANWGTVEAMKGLPYSDTVEAAIGSGAPAYVAPINGPEVCDMEYFFSKGRADIFGYMGFPDINPSEMVAKSTDDYFILDIKYFTDEHGVNTNKSEKELSFACTDKDTLETIIAGIVNSTTGTTVTDSKTNDEIYVVKF